MNKVGKGDQDWGDEEEDDGGKQVEEEKGVGREYVDWEGKKRKGRSSGENQKVNSYERNTLNSLYGRKGRYFTVINSKGDLHFFCDVWNFICK